jgi:hypothetical protein
MVQRHFLLVTFPAQGHINPALQFAKRLISLGAHVTFATSDSAHRRMTKSSPPPNGLSFASFSDCYDDGVRPEDDLENYLNVLKQNGSKTLTDLIVSSANRGRPFNCLVYTVLFPWAADMAREFTFLPRFFGFNPPWFWIYITTISMVLPTLFPKTPKTLHV